MTLWDKAVAELLDIIEWTDDTGEMLVWRFPRYENEIKQGAQLIVRPAQMAVFVNKGEIADIFHPGQHRLFTDNLPVLSTLMGWKYGFHSPFKAEVYFVSTRNFTNLKWGTKNPVIVRDREFGPVRLRAYGSYVLRIADPAKFVKDIAGSGAHFTIEGIVDQLRNIIFTRFADLAAESGIPVVDFSSRYDELSESLTGKVSSEFLQYGLEVTKLLIENISLPIEVEQALDKRSSMEIIGNLDNYVKFQGANAMEAAARNPGGDASAGVGMGIGFAMANQLAGSMTATASTVRNSSQSPSMHEPVVYFIARDGKRTGPFSLSEVSDSISAGEVSMNTLVWKEGMAAWEKAGAVPEISALLKRTPPPLP